MQIKWAAASTSDGDSATRVRLAGVATNAEGRMMDNPKSEFDKQKAALESVQAETPEEREAISKAVKLNREALEFEAQGRSLEAVVQFKFVDAVLESLRSGHYGDFKTLVEHFVSKHGL
jgi:hypothetical protein